MSDQDQDIKDFLTPPVRVFLHGCLLEKGIEKSDPKIIDDMVLDLAPRLYNWIWQAVFSNLPEEALPEWQALEKENSQEIWDFFRSKISNLDQILDNAMLEFKNIYVNA